MICVPWRVVLVMCHILCLNMTLNYVGIYSLAEEEEPVEEDARNSKNSIFYHEMPKYSVAGPNALARSVLIDRQERLQLNCDEIIQREIIEPQMFHHLLVDEQHKLLYCYVPKVACTNWKRVLMIATGKWSSQDPMEIPANLAHSGGIFRTLKNYTLEEIEEKLSSYNKLIVVRHPFERLLSAYRNKLESKHNSSMYFQDRFGKRIVKKYRINATREALDKGNDVTFREFVDFVTDDSENGSQNEHWRPITQLCHPCLVNYNLISKYETLIEDATEVLERMGAPWVRYISHAFSFYRFPTGPQSNEPTSKRLGRYYSTLSLKQLQKLTKLYSLDFKIFDYSLEDVLGFSLA